MAGGDFVSMKVTGLDQLEAQLLDLGAELAAKSLAAAARRAFKPVLETARLLVTRRTGDLDRAIRLATQRSAGGDTIVRVGLRIAAAKGLSKEVPAARRWHFIEFGTAHQGAHPFLRPALDQNADRVLELLKVELRKTIDRALKKRARK